MVCGSCGSTVLPGQHFCGTCGATLAAPPPPPPASTPVPPPPPTAATVALHVVEQTPVAPAPSGWPPTPAAGYPQYSTAPVPATAASGAVRATPLVVTAALAAFAGLVAAFSELYTIEVEGVFAETIKTGKLFENTTVAMVIVAAVLVGGALLGSTLRRIGSGLAGGAGLAIAGISGFHVALVLQIFQNAEQEAVDSGQSATLTFTHEIGFWAFAAATLLGLAVFVIARRDDVPDGMPALSTGVATAGVFATLAVVVGPLIPTDGASWTDNFETDNSTYVTIGRLASLALIGAAGWIGFVSTRRFGVGLALGGISVAVWQWFTTLTQDDKFVLGIGLTNPGANDFSPHPVTTIGIVGMVAAAVLQLVLGTTRTESMIPAPTGPPPPPF